ncbi:MAG TPA: outer membrane porin, OprD family [Thiotrichaceae bacterium]|nr:outer membrane porin, OprD family [Thiotrichaceae bacterium]HIM08209.1 outer membrane porin, OprD family [Gammaproteobacteria bacterium]
MIIIKYTRLLCVASIFSFVMSISPNLYAEPKYVLDEKPHPSSADKIKGALSSSFIIERLKGPFFPILKEKLQNLPPFFRDTKLGLNFRTFNFDRDNDGFVDVDGSNDNKAWTVGGSIDYQSGYLFDRLSLGASYYTSQKINGTENEGGTTLLEPVQNGFDVLGQSYVNYKLNDEINFRAYRQSFNLPYLNKQDNRMVPNTHEAFTITGLNALPKVNFIGGYVSKMKTRNSDSFKHLSSIAGATGTNDGLFMAGARYRINKHTNFGAINFYSFNIMNIFYTEANHLIKITDNIPLKLSAQFTDQRSIGNENIGNFDTRTGGVKASISYRGAVLTAAATITDKHAGIRSPYGGRPSYLSIIVKDFDRADEDAWLMGLAYDFSYIGLDGLSAYTNYAEGITPDTGSAASPDQSEWDITIDYRPQIPILEGLWFRYRRAEIDQDGTGAIDLVDNRFILNWEIPLS